MSDPNRIIVTRPTLSVDFSESTFDMPPSEVVFFDSVALSHGEELQKQLTEWPPENPPQKHEQPAFDVHRAIAGVLESSRFGRTIDYDDPTWTDIVNNSAYAVENERMQSVERSGKAADPQRAQVAVQGLAIYAKRLRAFMRASASDENVA